MRYATLCSGIEACSTAWHPLGMEPVFFSEIEAFPKAVLKHHYPNVPDLGDMTLYQQWKDYGSIDLICAGTPCQAFSVAGLREGLADPRGNLTLVFLGVLEKYRPKWVVWENVPGVLSDKSNAFGQFVAGLSELGYGVSWRVLDAQYFGVAQRRRRVFVVGCLGDWRASAAVLLDPHSLSGNPAPSRETGKGASGSAEKSLGRSGSAMSHAFKVRGGKEGGGKGYLGQDEAAFTISTGQDQMIAQSVTCDVSDTLTVGANQTYGFSGDIVAEITCFEDSRRDSVRINGEVSQTLSAQMGTGGGNTPMISHPIDFRNTRHHADLAGTLQSKSTGGYSLNYETGIQTGMAIRRITPMEAERLQGFPDGYTNIAWGKKYESPDSLRYKAIGNSMAVPVMRWIGERIQEVDNYIKENK